MYGGWGNDLLNADDDLSTCDPTTPADSTSTLAEREPDTHPIYEDRAYGGAGIDILIGNTGGDRLIDWVGEHNSLPRPVRAVRHRHRQPPGRAAAARVPVRALARATAPTRPATTTPAPCSHDPDRNGESEGELGLVTQQDHGYWQQQTGAAERSAAGQHPGRHSATSLRSANFNNGTQDTFAVDSGVWEVVERHAQRRGRVARPGRGGGLLPRRLQADLLRDRAPRSRPRSRPAAGRRTRTSSSTTSVADRLQVRGHRRLDQQARHRPPRRDRLARRRRRGRCPARCKPDTWYDLLVVDQRHHGDA